MEAYLTLPVTTISILSNQDKSRTSFAMKGALAPDLLREPTESKVKLFKRASKSLKLYPSNVEMDEHTFSEEMENKAKDETIFSPGDGDVEETWPQLMILSCGETLAWGRRR